MPGQTVIGVNDPKARKAYSVALFAETQRKASFRKNLTGPAPKQAAAERKAKGQTSPDYPFVRVNDLSKSMGDKVSVDLFNNLQGKPVMGDKKLAGRMMTLSGSSMDISINQMRGGVDTGGRMTNQRTLHNLRSLGKSFLVSWANRAYDQACLVHAAGARGYQDDGDWVVPLESDPDFSDIMVNNVLPPTSNRRFYAGDATSAANIDSGDGLTLNDIDRFRAKIDEMVYPLQPIKLEGDEAAEESPLYVMYISPRGWHQLLTQSTGQNFRDFQANALTRAKGFNHPLFLGDVGLWNGILVKKTNRVIRFPSGKDVVEVDAALTESTVQTTVDVDRGLILGAQALAIVHGRHSGTGYYFNWHEELTDHENTLEISVAAMTGKSKLRFDDPDGVATDHGVITVDHYAPEV